MNMTSAHFAGPVTRNPSLQDILVSLSFALDLTEGAVPGHAIRSCLLALRIGLQAGIDQAHISDLYYACLLKDVGCSSNSARMCQIVGGDDRIMKAEVKVQEWTRPIKPQISMLRLLWKQVLPGASFLDRGARILKMAASQTETAQELILLRCDRGAQIVRKLGLPHAVAVAVRHLDERWDGGGYPQKLKSHDIPLISRLMAIAQHLDAFAMKHGTEKAIDAMIERSGRWFDPELARAAHALHCNHHLWRQCRAEDSVEEARQAILDITPDADTPLNAFDIDSICEAFADVVDAKSPFTFRHSMRVMEAATAIGENLGLAPDRLQLLRRAALLHDVGKLGISNTILDKPGKLTDGEYTNIKSHPENGYQILRRISSFDEIALLAREHHERLDGSGYPGNLKADHLSIESRILATADIYGALSEKRPYRNALSPTEVAAIMTREVPTRTDPRCFEALKSLMSDDTWYLNEPSVELRESCALPSAYFHDEVYI